MAEGTRENFESPLDGVLNDLPLEEPPADLKDRCVGALREAEKAHHPTPQPIWPFVWKGALGLATAFVLMVGVLTMTSTKKAASPYDGRRMADAPQSEMMMAPESAKMMDSGPAQPAQEPAADVDEKVQRSWAPQPGAALPPPAPDAEEAVTVDAAPAARAAPGAAGQPMHRLEGVRARDQVSGSRFADGRIHVAEGDAGPVQKRVDESMMKAGAPLAQPTDTRLEMGDRTAIAEESEAEDAPEARRALQAVGGTYTSDAYVDPVQKPWRDYSPDRQKVRRMDMELEAEDVDDVHARATHIIEKEDGWIDSEELRMDEDGEAVAFINARIPVERFDGAIAQLRELGKVVRLLGESDDRTKQYQRLGGQIREMGAREVELVDKYEKEKDKRRKQQLYNEIMRLREQYKTVKPVHQELSEQTHYSYLNLTISQAAGPKQFMGRIMESVPTAAAWLAVSAIFWVPALVVAFVIWRRVTAKNVY